MKTTLQNFSSCCHVFHCVLAILSGYGRIVLAIIAFYFMQTNYVIAGWCYIISALLDAVDGHAARAFNQSEWPAFFSYYIDKIFLSHNSIIDDRRVIVCFDGRLRVLIRDYLSEYEVESVKYKHIIISHVSYNIHRYKVWSYAGSIDW